MMRISLSGRVLYRNHLPAKDVEVRVFDQDEPGRVDDDLTIMPGKTDESGAFKVVYDPALYKDMIPDPRNEEKLIRDPSDKYIPYARLSYDLNGQKQVFISPILRFRREYVLPESKPLDIDPRVHSFAFPNSFPGYPLPFRMPALPGIKEVDSIHGLCGGLSAAVYDFYLCGRPVPETTVIPVKGTPLYRYLYKRQSQTYGTIGETILKFAEWMLMSDDGLNSVRYRAYQSLENIKAELDNDNAVLLGLVYVDWRNGFQLWNNHQVLAYRYTVNDDGSKTTLFICDPNYPRNSTVKIESEKIELGRATTQGQRSEMQFGVISSQWVNGQKIRPVRGFFAIPYAQIVPPKNL
jgi:hypothetical protein